MTHQIETHIPICREAKFADLHAIVTLLKNIGLEENKSHAVVQSKWVKILRENPATAHSQKKQFSGWVLECNQQLVGFFGNIYRRYSFEHENLLVSVASSWAVKKEFRAFTHLLSDAYFNQQDVDLFMVTSAIKPTARIFERFSGQALPQPDYNQVCFWILNPHRLFISALIKKNINWKVANFMSCLLWPLIITFRVQKFLNLSSEHHGNIRIESCDSIGPEFDDLWRRKTKNEHCLFAYRKAEDLLWVSSISKLSNDTTLLSYRSNNELIGYILLLKQDIVPIYLKRAKIIDLFVINDDPTIVNALMTAAYNDAKKTGYHVLEFHGFPDRIREHIAMPRHFVRLYKNFSYYFKAVPNELSLKLQNNQSWYACPFDGDSFC